MYIYITEEIKTLDLLITNRQKVFVMIQDQTRPNSEHTNGIYAQYIESHI